MMTPSDFSVRTFKKPAIGQGSQRAHLISNTATNMLVLTDTEPSKKRHHA